MADSDTTVFVYTTLPSPQAAEAVGGALVDRGLAACVNIIPGMTSIFIWQGKRCKDAETAMLIKTRAELANQVMAEARALHPYDNPALVVLPVAGGSADFLAWVRAQTGGKAS